MSICAQCSKRQMTCCQDSDIFVTLGDITRITRYLIGDNKAYLLSFFEMRPAAKVYMEYAQSAPGDLWSRMTIAEGYRRVVKKEQENCYFLSPKGCILPMEIRPLICRIYPYDFNQDGILPIDENQAYYCPKGLVGNNPPAALEMSIEDAERWHKMLYDELGMEEKIVTRK